MLKQQIIVLTVCAIIFLVLAIILINNLGSLSPAVIKLLISFLSLTLGFGLIAIHEIIIEAYPKSSQRPDDLNQISDKSEKIGYLFVVIGIIILLVTIITVIISIFK